MIDDVIYEYVSFVVINGSIAKVQNICKMPFYLVLVVEVDKL